MLQDDPSTPLRPKERSGQRTEFRGGRRNALSLLCNLLGLSFLCVVIGLLVKQRSLLICVLFLAGAAILLQVLGFFVSRRCRLVLTERDLRVAAGIYSRVIPWDHIRAAVFLKDRNELILHLSDGTSTPIGLGHYWRPDQARGAVESHLSDFATTTEVRTDRPTGPVAAILVAVATTGFYAALFGSLENLASAAPCLCSSVAGVVVSLLLLRFGPRSSKTRHRLCWILFSAGLIGAVLTSYLAKLGPSDRFSDVVTGFAAALGFGTGLVLPQAVAMIRQMNAETRRAILSAKKTAASDVTEPKGE